FQGTITNTGGELCPRRSRTLLRERRERGTKPTVGGVVRRCKRIERVLCRHTDSDAADTERVRAEYLRTRSTRSSGSSAQIRPDVRGERCRRQTAVPKLPEIFKVGKYGQIFVADIAVERTVEIFAVGGGDFWGQIGEVKEKTLAGLQEVAVS